MAVFSSGNNKQKEQDAPQGKISMIATGVVIEGVVSSKGDIRIEGEIKGTLLCNAKVVLGRSGSVKGDIESRTATIAGKVEGTICVHEFIHLQESAKIEGDLIYEKIQMDPGAVIAGQMRTGKEAREEFRKKHDTLRKQNAPSTNSQPANEQKREAVKK